MRICLLASGSKGNAIYIESRECRMLIDAGFSAKELSRRLEGIGVAADSLHALFATHEHSDHSHGLGPMARRYALDVFIKPETIAALPRLGAIEKLREFETGTSFCCRDVQVEAFPLTHDAASPVGFVIETGEGRVGVATDLGIATRLVQQRLKGCRVLILETNHDEEMLRDGPYPWHLKQRIRSNHGHLSNRAGAALLDELRWEGLEAVFLAHLSETNNNPQLAEAAVGEVLDRQNLCGPQLITGCQGQASVCFNC